METKELIKENNKKRSQLTKENLKYYEDILLYIRLSFSKIEREAEEILSELLDHLLEAQKEGKRAEEVFGNDPKQYTQDIIDELPKMSLQKGIQLFFMGILYFLAGLIFFTGIFDLLLYYVFSIGSLRETYYIGSEFVKVLIFIPTAFLFLSAMVYHLRWTCFKKINKVLDFLITWVYGVVFFGVLMLIIYLVPNMGPAVAVPAYVLLLIGVVLYVVARVMRTSKY